MADIRTEFHRLFTFCVKHGPKLPWPNRDIKKFLIWAWDMKHLFVVYDGEGNNRRICAAAIAWRTDHPENRFDSLINAETNQGDYLNVYMVIVHPEYRRKGCMLLLLAMTLEQYKGIKRIFWNSNRRNPDINRLRIIDTNTLGRELLKWDNLHVFNKKGVLK